MFTLCLCTKTTEGCAFLPNMVIATLANSGTVLLYPCSGENPSLCGGPQIPWYMLYCVNSYSVSLPLSAGGILKGDSFTRGQVQVSRPYALL